MFPTRVIRIRQAARLGSRRVENHTLSQLAATKNYTYIVLLEDKETDSTGAEEEMNALFQVVMAFIMTLLNIVYDSNISPADAVGKHRNIRPNARSLDHQV